MKRWPIAFVTLCVFCTNAVAQKNPPAPTPHQHPQPEMIDGRDHPELIPDLAAYRLYLIVVSHQEGPVATETEKRYQTSHLGMMQLSEHDNQALLPVNGGSCN